MRKSLEKLLKSIEKPIAVFDLDGTLFNVNYRHHEIIRRFIEKTEIKTEYPEQVEILKKLKDSDFKYSVESTLNFLGIERYSERSARFIHLCDNFWFKHFFTDELLAYDKPYDGARECVDFFYKHGAQIVYLSGRDIPNMSKGTILSLENHGFHHTGHRVSIFLKPAYGEDDLLFKKHTIESLHKIGNVAVSFDNEPANVQLFLDSFPSGIHFHFDSAYAKPLELKGSHLRVIKNFSELNLG